MSKELTVREKVSLAPEVINKMVTNGDLSGLKPEELTSYYLYRCNELGLDPAEKPFEVLVFKGKKTLYALKACTDALCRTRALKREITSKEKVGEIYVVTCRVTEMSTGRSDESTGAVLLGALRGEDLCNAMMKAETKAKRRAVLSLCGLGMLDETEVESIKSQDPGVRESRTTENNVAPKDFGALEAEFKEADTRTDRQKNDDIFKGDDLPHPYGNVNPPPPMQEKKPEIPPILVIPDTWCDRIPGLTALKGILISDLNIDQLNDAAVEVQKVLKSTKSDPVKEWTTRLLKVIADRMDVNFNNSKETKDENHN